jgi:hypothetical protein
MGQFDFNNPVHQFISSSLGYSISDSDYPELDNSENIYDDMPDLIAEEEPYYNDLTIFTSHQFYITHILTSAYEIITPHLMIILPMPTGFQYFLSFQFPFDQFISFGTIQPYMLLLTC